MFGNPGSTELPMLARLPRRLHATSSGCRRRSWSGWPTATRRRAARPTLVNLHTAPGRRQRDGRDLQRAGQPLAAGDHRRPAGALADHDAGEPDQPRRDPDAAPARQVELRAAARPRTCRWRSPARSTSRRCRHAARRSSRSRWTTGTPRSTTPTRRRRDRPRARPAGAPAPRRRRSPSSRAARGGEQPGAGRRPGHRRQRRLGGRGRAGRAPAAAGVGDPGARRRPDRLPRGPPATSAACCRRRSGRSPRRSRATT